MNVRSRKTTLVHSKDQRLEHLFPVTITLKNIDSSSLLLGLTPRHPVTPSHHRRSPSVQWDQHKSLKSSLHPQVFYYTDLHPVSSLYII